jgi:pyrroline-5-carboxylate reductase
MDMHDKKLLLVGAGKMGGALLHAWLKAGITSITIVKRTPANDALINSGCKIAQSFEAVKDNPDCIVIAVKPQMMDEVLPKLAKQFGNNPFYISIAAGKTLTYFAKYLTEAQVARAMPNTPSVIGIGITALCANEKTSQAQKDYAAFLFKAAGEIIWLENESQMDAATAISGSGPAYTYLFIQSLIEAGMAQGLPEHSCRQLALQTVKGSAELALSSSDLLDVLRQNVTSPGGTTEAALKILMQEDALKQLIGKAVDAAIKRAKELA